MSKSLIRPRTCGNCGHSIRTPEATLACRRNPPVAQQAFGLREDTDQQGKTVMVPFLAGKANTFPTVEPDWFCGEHKPKIVRPELIGPIEGAA